MGKSFSFYKHDGVGRGLGLEGQVVTQLAASIGVVLAHHHQLPCIPTLPQPWWGGGRTCSQPALQRLCHRKSPQVVTAGPQAALLSP